MATSDNDQLTEWASALLDEVLVKAALDIHQAERLHSEIKVDLTFTVSSVRDSGHVTVTSPGSRGKSINVEVPVAEHRTS